MMTATGMLFLAKAAPLCTTAADGTFVLTLLAFDRMGTHQVEPWRITWCGDQAKAFAAANKDKLTPGRPVEVAVHKVRSFTVGHRGTAEILAAATHIALAPLAHSEHPHP